MLKPVITILLYLFTPMLFGQSLINMKHYSVQDGLSQKNVHNFIQDDNVPVPADAAAFTLLKEQLEEVLGTLTEREQKVLTLRFGLEDGRARTLEEVGREFNVTRERIRQIEAKALRKLKNPNRCKRLRDFVK